MLDSKWSFNNYVRNFYFIVFAVSYGIMQVRMGFSFLVSMIGIFVAMSYILGKVKSVRDFFINKSRMSIILSSINSLGIVCANYVLSKNYFLLSINSESGKIQSLCIKLGIEMSEFTDIVFILFGIFTILSYPFVYWILSFLVENILRTVSEIEMKKYIMSFGKYEKIIYFSIVLCQIIVLSWFFCKSVAGFAGPCDIIYGTDSAMYGSGARFLHVDTSNIRQPLIEMIASPFIGWCYIFNFIPSVGNTVAAIFMQATQIFLLFGANILLIRNLGIKDKGIRILGILLISFSYSNLEGCIIVEKYIFAYFWLMLYCSYTLFGKKDRYFMSYALIGSMITSALLVPFVEFKKVKYQLKETLLIGWKMFVKLIFYISLTGHLGMLFSTTDINDYIENGVNNILSRIYQFFEFWNAGLFGPKTEIINRFDNITWFLKDPVGLNIVGVIIFLVMIITLISVKNDMRVYAVIWIVLSVILFVIGGWGTAQNELAIYYLYFSWLVFVGLFSVFSKMKTKYAYFAMFLLLVIEFYMNIPAIYELIKFSIYYYPA